MNGEKRRGRPKGLKPPKRQYPLKLDEDTRGQLTAAAYWTRQSANALIEEGIGIVVRRLRETHNGGKPFPPRPGRSVAADGHQDVVEGGGGQPSEEKPAKRRGSGPGAKKGKERPTAGSA